MLIAVGYSRMNTVRQDIYNRLKKYKYHIASYIHSSVKIPECVSLGEGNIILEHVCIGLFGKLGNGNLLWAHALLGHNCSIGDFNTISSSASVSGCVEVKDNCFIGNNATVRDHVKIDSFTLVGAGTYISKDTEKGSVYVPARAVKLDRHSMDINL